MGVFRLRMNMNNIKALKTLCTNPSKIVVGLIFFMLASLVFIFPAKCDSIIDKYVGGLGDAYGTAIYTNVKSNMHQLLLCEMTYHSDHKRYINCPPNPKSIPGKKPLAWETGRHYDSWKNLGFEMKGKVYYQYKVINAGKDTFKAIAKGDRDGDGICHVITITEKGIINEVNAGE